MLKQLTANLQTNKMQKKGIEKPLSHNMFKLTQQMRKIQAYLQGLYPLKIEVYRLQLQLREIHQERKEKKSKLQLSRVAQQYASRGIGGDKSAPVSGRRGKSKSLYEPDQNSQEEDNKNATHPPNILTVKDTKKTKRGPSQEIETVLDGSSGGSGFKQKAKGILGIRHSSRNSSIGSNQSVMSSERMRAGAQLEFGHTDKKPKSPRIPTLKIPLNSAESSYSSNKFKYDQKINRNNLSVSTDRTYRYTGMSELSPQKHELLTKFFPTKSQLYSVLSRLNKLEMLLLKNLKKHYKDQDSKSVNGAKAKKTTTQVKSNRTFQRRNTINTVQQNERDLRIAFDRLDTKYEAQINQRRLELQIQDLILQLIQNRRRRCSSVIMIPITTWNQFINHPVLILRIQYQGILGNRSIQSQKCIQKEITTKVSGREVQYLQYGISSDGIFSASDSGCMLSNSLL